MKMAQFVSARGDLLDDVTIRALRELQNAVPPDKDETVPEIRGYDVDSVPIASASVATVYRGTRTSDGASVAIKKIRPGVRHRVEQDIPLLLEVLAWAKVLGFAGAENMSEIVRECRPVIFAELDLREEAKLHVAFAREASGTPWLIIPKVYRATETSMVSEFVASRKITDAVPTPALAKRLFDLYIRMVLQWGLVHADPHAGNIGVRSDGTVVLYDFGAVIDVRDAQPFIAKLLKSVILDDVDGVVDALTRMGIIKNASVSRLRRAIPKIRQLAGSPNFNEELSKLPEFTDNDNRLFELTTKYVYLIRSLVIVQGIIAYHDPSFDLRAYAERYDDLIASATDVPMWDVASEFATDVLSTPGNLRAMQNAMVDMKDTMAHDFAGAKRLAIRAMTIAVATDVAIHLLAKW